MRDSSTKKAPLAQAPRVRAVLATIAWWGLLTLIVLLLGMLPFVDFFVFDTTRLFKTRIGHAAGGILLWAFGTFFVYVSCALVIWPRELIARDASGIGTKQPDLARACGLLGFGLGTTFVVMSGAGEGEYRLNLVPIGFSVLASIIVVVPLLRSLKSHLGKSGPLPWLWPRSYK